MATKKNTESKQNKEVKVKFPFKNKGIDLDNSPLVKDTEEKLEDAFAEAEDIKDEQSAAAVVVHTDDAPVAVEPQGKAPTAEKRPRRATMPPTDETPTEEPTKGIQTAIPMSLYARLLMLKVKQGRSIREMVTEAVRFWVAYQEGAK